MKIQRYSARFYTVFIFLMLILGFVIIYSFKFEPRNEFDFKIVTSQEFIEYQESFGTEIETDSYFLLPNTYAYFNNLDFDDSIIKETKKLQEKPFYYVLLALNQDNNLRSIVDFALNNLDYNFVVDSIHLKGLNANELLFLDNYSNIIVLDSMTNNQIKTLIYNSKSIIIPSDYSLIR